MQKYIARQCRMYRYGRVERIAALRNEKTGEKERKEREKAA